ncbi:TIGR01777 family oxidoreductase [Flavobacterium crassostreae]|uniref:Cell division protein n=1 Tax=Flavobacterium crassostreae TaxID=1763534 RepID=A0A1B9E7G0_9FLAO|nr:TIGR01777 family oxidoreductase [Flavobacterium crassostreae]OCB77885.1 cell division protein [Flavobacterium crassostreae]
MKKNVLITGGTGFVGKNLTKLLLSKGFTVAILSRSKRPDTENVFYYTWDIEKQTIEEDAVLKADYIIHLAGENIAAKRWTTKRKKAIIASREHSIRLLYSVLATTDKKPEAFISASAIGIYGAYNGQEICLETTAAANDFLGKTCQIWESSVATIAALGIRTVAIRTGLVLGKDAGLLQQLKPVFKYRLGAALGTGEQYMPWVHIDDLCNAYYVAIINQAMHGPYNVAVTDHTTNKIFSKTLASAYGYKLWLPNIPSFLLALAMGQMAVIVLKGRRVSSAKIQKTGFEFKWDSLKQALQQCI